MFPSPASQSGDPEESAPQSGGRRRIVPFVAKRTEAPRPAPRARAKEPAATEPTRAPVSKDDGAAEDIPQTLVPLPRRPVGATAAAAPVRPTAAPLKKDAFIRSFPADVRASEVQAAGAAKGLTITVGYVHWVRSRAKAAEQAQSSRLAKKQAKGAPAAKGARTSPAPTRPKAARLAAPLDPSADAGLAQAVTLAAIASARMPNRQASERSLIENAARWVGFDRAIELLRTAQTRVDLLLRPLRALAGSNEGLQP